MKDIENIYKVIYNRGAEQDKGVPQHSAARLCVEMAMA